MDECNATEKHSSKSVRSESDTNNIMPGTLSAPYYTRTATSTKVTRSVIEQNGNFQENDDGTQPPATTEMDCKRLLNCLFLGLEVRGGSERGKIKGAKPSRE
eukprot:2374963-Pleurochrysis_carterae.AAC.2